MSRARSSQACLLFAAFLAACSMRDGVLGRMRSEGGPDGSGETSAACMLTSPSVVIDGHPTCTGRLAAARFANALCVCNDLELGGSLTTHGFDSSQWPYQAGFSEANGAAVGVDGNYLALAGATDVAGSLAIAGSNDLRFAGLLRVRGDFFAAGNVTAAGSTSVGRHAWLGGSFTGFGPFTVAGSLHHAGTVTALPLLAGTMQAQAVTVAKSCACSASDLVDVAALVATARADNDNARVGVSADALASLAGEARLTLPCGRIFLSRIAGGGNLTLQVSGQAALFVGGSIDFRGSLTFDLAPGAAVDVFVEQDLLVEGSLGLASKDRPAAGRIWVGGARAVTLASPWVGNLYAPRARVVIAGGWEAWGAVVAGSLAGGGFASFYFDRAVLAAGATCSAPRPPPGVCTRCTWCVGGNACVAGQCGPCRNDDDCCGLSVCSNGSCVPLVELGE